MTNSMGFHRLKVEWLLDLAMCTYPKERKSACQRDIWIPIFIAALHIIVKYKLAYMAFDGYIKRRKFGVYAQPESRSPQKKKKNEILPKAIPTR